MMAMLLEKGVLRWDMTVGEILSDIPMRDEYRGVSLEQLLQHHGGVPNLPSTGEFLDGFPTKAGQSPAQARTILVSQALSESPIKQGEYSYSSAGYVVAGCMAERVTRRGWEDLMQSLLFEPLQLQSTGFGWPADEGRPNQPRGHYGAPPELRVQEMGEYMLGDMDYIGPAGNLHCSIEDLARFAAFHLRVLSRRDDMLEVESVLRFWRAEETDKGERRFGFFGSGGTFMAMIAVYPDSDFAIVAATNYGLPAMPVFERMRDSIHKRMRQAD
jgi:CubicO group peptidase (beta-lactamase class C family)